MTRKALARRIAETYLTSRQRREAPAPPQPEGLRGFWPGALLLVSQRPPRVFSLLAPRTQPKFAAALLYQPQTWCTSSFSCFLRLDFLVRAAQERAGARPGARPYHRTAAGSRGNASQPNLCYLCLLLFKFSSLSSVRSSYREQSGDASRARHFCTEARDMITVDKTVIWISRPKNFPLLHASQSTRSRASVKRHKNPTQPVISPENGPNSNGRPFGTPGPSE